MSGRNIIGSLTWGNLAKFEKLTMSRSSFVVEYDRIGTLNDPFLKTAKGSLLFII